MGINLISPAGFTSAVLIADTIKTTGGSNDSISSLTKVNGVPVSAAFEVQSTLGTILNARQTTAQINALPTVVDGMQVYDSTLGVYKFRANGTWGIFSDTLNRYATGTITSPQILALYNTPVQLIPAPGAGFAIIVKSFALELIFGVGAYTAGGAVYLQYGNTAHGANIATTAAGIPAAFIQGAANAMISVDGTVNSTTGIATATTGNAAITITNATQVFATGAGTLNWYAWYAIVPIT